MAFNKEQRAFWRELNRDAIREYQRKWRALNVLPKEPRKLKTPEEKKAAKRAYYKAHKAEYQERSRRWRADPKNRVKENRRYRQRYRRRAAVSNEEKNGGERHLRLRGMFCFLNLDSAERACSWANLGAGFKILGPKVAHERQQSAKEQCR